MVSTANAANTPRLSQFLRMAIAAGVESAVRIHIARGDDLNACDANGMTPLMIAASRNKAAICELLLSAGVDHGLRDPSGRTALEIAVAAGADDSAVVLDANNAPPRCILTSLPGQGLVPTPAVIDLPASDLAAPTVAEHVNPPELTEVAAPLHDQQPARNSAAEPSPFDGDDGEEFDLTGWEAEEAATPPEVDQVILGSTSAIQVAISLHEPIDSSIGWDDIEAYLPEQALPLARADDTEGRARLRRLLLRAIREGSVPSLDVHALSINDDRSDSPEAEALLTMVVNDLGAEVDERFEYSDAFENFEVYVDPDESSDEEALLDDALATIDIAASARTEPLRIYQREFQRLRLLSAEEEVELAQTMEATLESALDALAAWPDGIARTIAAGADALAGRRPLSSIWSGDTEPDPDAASMDNPDATSPEAEPVEEASDEESEPIAEVSPDTGFADALNRLRALAAQGKSPPASLHDVRLSLAALRLNRRFLLELIDAADGPTPCPGFRHAMAIYRKARDRMTAANLKLAFFHAKKYLYSGEPLDDLAQEGNVGLLKAVDRYDWRRGFRFSTYATWWIRQQIGRHVADKARTIRVPVHIYEKAQRMERVAEAFEKAVGREPSIDELAKLLEMPARKVATLQHIAPEPSPIDELSINELIAIDTRDALLPADPAELVEAAELRTAVDEMISSLPDKDARILRLRFGIGIDEALTLEEVGQLYAVTRERIRQIEAKAIRKLKHPARVESFTRMALGMRSETRSPVSITSDTDAEEMPGSADRTSEPPAPSKQVCHQISGVPSQSARAPKPSSLEWVLAQAAELGIKVDDDRLGLSGHIWVGLLEMPDKVHRRLVRRLLELGFAFWPGKGYWR